MSSRRGSARICRPRRLMHQQGEIMISSLEHRCSRVEAGPGRYFMKNGVNRCGTNRTERKNGRLGRGGGRGRKGEEKEGEKEWASSRASSAAGDVFLSCVRGNVVRASDVKCMYNLQTENYFNCSAKHPAASINQRRLCATREKKKIRLTCYSSPYFFREYRIPANSLIEIHLTRRRLRRVSLRNIKFSLEENQC